MMRLRERGYEIEISGYKIGELEERMLESGLCNFTVPMWFSRDGDKIKATYECSGYTSLRDMALNNPREVFEIIEKTFLSLNRSVEFYIPSESVMVNLDTVFFNKVSRTIKLAYIPDENNNLEDKIKAFLNEIIEVSGQEVREYLSIVKNDIYQIRDLRDAANLISSHRKKIARCQGKIYLENKVHEV